MPIAATPPQMGFGSTAGMSYKPPMPINYTGGQYPVGGSKTSTVSSIDKPHWNATTGEVQTPFTRMDALLERQGGTVPPGPFNPMDIWDTMNRDYPDAILDPTDITTKIIISKMAESDRWPMELFPLKRTEKLTVEFTQWIFADTAMTRVPEESTGRYSSSYKQHFREALIRVGHQIKMEMNHMATPEGALELTYKLWQIAFAIEEGNCHDVIVACLAADHWDPKDPNIERVWRKSDKSGDGSLLSKFRSEFNAFACINKGGNMSNLRTTVLRASEEFAKINQGIKPNRYILPAGVAAYWAESTERNNQFWITGHPNVSLGAARSDTLVLPDGVRYYESRSFRLGQYVTEDDPMLRSRSCGSYFWMNDEHTRGVPLLEQKTSMYDLKVQDESKDKMSPWRYKEHVADMGIYNNWRLGLDMATLKDYHPSLSLAGTIFMGLNTNDNVNTIADMYNKKISSAHFNEAVTAIASKPELLVAIQSMLKQPFKWSEESNTKHLDHKRPYFAQHREEPYNMQRGLFSMGAGEGQSLSDYSTDLSNKIKNRISAYQSDRITPDDDDNNNSRSGGRWGRPSNNGSRSNRVVSYRPDIDSIASTDEDDDSGDEEQSFRRGNQNRGRYPVPSRFSKTGASGGGRSRNNQNRMDVDGEEEHQQHSKSSSLPLATRIRNFFKKVLTKDQQVSVTLDQVVGAAIILDDKTNNALGATKHLADILEKQTNLDYPGAIAWKIIEPSWVYDDINTCWSETKKHGVSTALETFIDTQHDGNFFIRKTQEQALNTQANEINSDKCYMVDIQGMNTENTVDLPCESGFTVLATLNQSTNYVTLSSRRLALMHIPPEIALQFVDNKSDRAFSLRKGAHMPLDSSLAQGKERLCALHYNTVLSYLASLIQSFPMGKADVDLAESYAEAAKKICKTPQFNNIPLMTYNLHVNTIQETFQVANSQVALEPTIRALVEITKVVSQNGSNGAIRSALFKAAGEVSNSSHFLALHGVDLKTLTKTKEPSTGAGSGMSAGAYQRSGRSRAGVSGSGSDDPVWKEALLAQFRSDKQIYMSSLGDGNQERKSDDSAPLVNMVNENAYVRFLHDDEGLMAMNLLLTGLGDVYDVLPAQIGDRYSKLEAFLIIARLAHMTLLARDFREGDYNPLHRAIYLLNYFYHIGRIEAADIEYAQSWLDNLIGARGETDDNPLYNIIVEQMFEKRTPLNPSRMLAGVRVGDDQVKITPERLQSLRQSGTSRIDREGISGQTGLVNYFSINKGLGASTSMSTDDVRRYKTILGARGDTIIDRLNSMPRGTIQDDRDLALAIHSFAAQNSDNDRDRQTKIREANRDLTQIVWKHPAWNDAILVQGPNYPTFSDYLLQSKKELLTLRSFTNEVDGRNGGQASGPSGGRRRAVDVEREIVDDINSGNGAESDEDASMTEEEFAAYPIGARKKVVRHFLEHFPVEDGRLIYLMIEFDVKPPFGYVCYRPFRTYLMGCMLAIYSTAEQPVGVTAYHPFRMTLGEDNQTQVVTGQVTGWSRAIALNKDMIMKVNDVYCKNYKYGNDLTSIPWARSSIVNNQLSSVGTYGGSVIATPRWINFECYSQPQDVTGEFPAWITANQSEKKLCEYALSGHVCGILKLNQSTINGTAWEDSFIMSNNRPTDEGVNTTCFQGCQMRYNPVTGDYDDVIVENGHWGEEVGDGCCSNIREGFPGEVKHYNYSKSSTWYVGK